VSVDAIDAVVLCNSVDNSGSETHGFNLTISGTGTGTGMTRTSVFARYVVWAGGHQSFPWIPTDADVPGTSLGMHASTVPSWAALVGRSSHTVVVVGGSDSGLELAAGLVDAGCMRVVVCDGRSPWHARPYASESPSVTTLVALREANNTGRITLVPHHATTVTTSTSSRGFVVSCGDGGQFSTPIRPVFATGYTIKSPVVANLFSFGADTGGCVGCRRSIHLNGVDESLKTPGVRVCLNTMTHARAHAHTHTHTHTYIHTYIHTHARTRARTHAYAADFTHTHTHTCTREHTLTLTHSLTHSLAHSHVRTCTHTHTHSRA
jgi:hypothetical protein